MNLAFQENSFLHVLVTEEAVGWLDELVVLGVESEAADPAVIHQAA